MTNAFDWMKYTDEERAKSDPKLRITDEQINRSNAASRGVEAIRKANPNHGIIASANVKRNSFTLKPRQFTVYSKVRTDEIK
jgi:hypothetical protein